MANSLLCINSGNELVGTQVCGTGGACFAVDQTVRNLYAAAGTGTGVAMDSLSVDLAGSTKECGILLTLSGSTAITIDLTNTVATGAGITSVAGSTGFSTINSLLLKNIGAQDLTIAPGASNGARVPIIAGTTPTLTIPAGGAVYQQTVAGVAVDGTHKNVTVTPTSGGLLSIAIAGS